MFVLPAHVVIATDETDEAERIAGWCKRQIAHKADARLLVILPGSPGHESDWLR